MGNVYQFTAAQRPDISQAHQALFSLLPTTAELQDTSRMKWNPISLRVEDMDEQGVNATTYAMTPELKRVIPTHTLPDHLIPEHVDLHGYGTQVVFSLASSSPLEEVFDTYRDVFGSEGILIPYLLLGQGLHYNRNILSTSGPNSRLVELIQRDLPYTPDIVSSELTSDFLENFESDDIDPDFDIEALVHDTRRETGFWFYETDSAESSLVQLYCTSPHPERVASFISQTSTADIPFEVLRSYVRSVRSACKPGRTFEL